MVFNQLNRIVVAASVLFAGVASAHDFSAADALFQQRQSGTSKIQAAINAYSQAQRQGSLSDVEQVYAAEQKGRLYMYWGYVVNQSDKALRETIANGCLSAIEAIKPSTKLHRSPQYYYWKAACLMARANARGVMASLADSQQVVDAINAGSALDPAYEGGGFDRLSGVMFSKLPPLNPLGPNGDMPRALRHFRRAFDAGVYDDPMFPDWKDPDTEIGEYFYSGYFYYAEALKKNGDRAEAKDIAQEALDRIEDGDLPVGREPEARVAKAKLVELLRSL